MYRRSSLEPPPPLPKQHARLRKPPYPPKEKCVTCTQFTRQGSTGYTIKETCLVCGHATTTRRDLLPQYPVNQCPHEDRDFRGSSRSVHRTFCKQCCAFWTRLRCSSKRLEKCHTKVLIRCALTRFTRRLTSALQLCLNFHIPSFIFSIECGYVCPQTGQVCSSSLIIACILLCGVFGSVPLGRASLACVFVWLALAL